MIELIITRRPIKALNHRKKQLSLGCNGAPGSPGSLEMIPHVLLASTWQTNLNESESLSSYQTSASQMFRQKKNRPHFPIRRW